MPINIEIKCQCQDLNKVREILKKENAEFKGTDHQIDTYFNSKRGRLKLREGDMGSILIHYERENTIGSKESKFTLYKTEKDSKLKAILKATLDNKCTIEKTREIYSIDNVKFHLDTVKDLGTFVEIEASNKDNELTKDKLQEQCNFYIKRLKINSKDLIADSYSDMIQRNNLFSQILIDED
ncbi:class IV adenylate cyclase [Ancylomarina sp. 16SWW S1-10-2]|uniref:class IV adenylate cyclase n=1 Tax=Ancylomarina sp. 16SWW S1-10-2 TaxID=2499681 RepID=UPI0012AE4F6E|nr:class IV adenylate cyclase [Ancylomarina sp. 16SWW S1-10-2]MRT93116.1 CYTH domain-containing protein [Ancylomarina sp. 16SWW S1-10-2]